MTAGNRRYRHRPPYGPEEKQAAVARAIEVGLTRTSEELGMLTKTLATWCEEAGVLGQVRDAGREWRRRHPRAAPRARPKRERENRTSARGLSGRVYQFADAELSAEEIMETYGAIIERGEELFRDPGFLADLLENWRA